MTTATDTVWTLSSTSATSPLRDALAGLAKSCPDAIGYVMSPRAAWWIRCARDEWWGADAGSERRAEDEITDVFEARAFGADGEGRPTELRWVRAAAEEGTAVTLTASEGDVAADPAVFDGALRTLPGFESPAWLLWGECTGREGPGGWVELADARTGSFWVPLKDRLDAGARLAFDVLEFTATDQHGNCYVADELVRGLRKAKPRS